MARLTRQTQTHLADAPSLRLRTAWLYHNRGWTQAAIAENLGISRSTVIRMLEEARARAEVQVWINPTPGDCTALALSVEEKFGLDEVIVVPGEGSTLETAQDVGAALGQFLSEVITDNMVIGATWGRTLNAALQTFRPVPRANTRVVSLLGGILEAKAMNPVDFSWQLASRLNAECMLYLAPLFVDSAETKRALIDKCGLDRLLGVAQALDLAIISCGDLGTTGSSMTMDFLGPEERAALLAAGAICDAGCNFLDAEGRDVDTPLRHRIMNVDLGTIARAGHVILAAGGARRAAAIRATVLRTNCRTLITDEAAATALLQL
ncbi:MAG TPA: sugar-binding domain-containing protein [Tabrizicola sp.]|nr:sugar-binding domain-containing protein [Tabrizicola sp.]